MRPRRGMALVTALTLIALLGLAVAGALSHTVVSQRAATLSQNAAALDAAADRALGTVLGDASSYDLAALHLGEARAFAVEPADTPGLTSTVHVTRLAGDVLWMVATASLRRDSSAVRRVSLIARFPTVGAPPPAALVARGNVSLGDAVRLTVDSAQDADCDAAVASAVVVAPGATVRVPSGIHADTSGSARDSATYYLTQRQLAMLAGAAGVIHVTGDTTIDGGSLAGILIVDGSLTLRGTVAATGLVVARGAIDGSGATLTMRGALLSYAAPPNVSTILTAASVEYSPCVVAHVMRVALSPRVVRLRSWAELF